MIAVLKSLIIIFLILAYDIEKNENIFNDYRILLIFYKFLYRTIVV